MKTGSELGHTQARKTAFVIHRWQEPLVRGIFREPGHGERALQCANTQVCGTTSMGRPLHKPTNTVEYRIPGLSQLMAIRCRASECALVLIIVTGGRQRRTNLARQR